MPPPLTLHSPIRPANASSAGSWEGLASTPTIKADIGLATRLVLSVTSRRRRPRPWYACRRRLRTSSLYRRLWQRPVEYQRAHCIHSSGCGDRRDGRKHLRRLVESHRPARNFCTVRETPFLVWPIQCLPTFRIRCSTTLARSHLVRPSMAAPASANGPVCGPKTRRANCNSFKQRRTRTRNAYNYEI